MKNKSKNVAPRKPGNPVFRYTSVCCKEPATKTPVARRVEDIRENKYSECSLGKWSCTKCSKPCKVTRSKNKEA